MPPTSITRLARALLTEECQSLARATTVTMLRWWRGVGIVWALFLVGVGLVWIVIALLVPSSQLRVSLVGGLWNATLVLSRLLMMVLWLLAASYLTQSIRTLTAGLPHPDPARLQMTHYALMVAQCPVPLGLGLLTHVIAVVSVQSAHHVPGGWWFYCELGLRIGGNAVLSNLQLGLWLLALLAAQPWRLWLPWPWFVPACLVPGAADLYHAYVAAAGGSAFIVPRAILWSPAAAVTVGWLAGVLLLLAMIRRLALEARPASWLLYGAWVLAAYLGGFGFLLTGVVRQDLRQLAAHVTGSAWQFVQGKTAMAAGSIDHAAALLYCCLVYGAVYFLLFSRRRWFAWLY